MNNAKIENIRNMSGVKTASQWKDRIYVNLYTAGNYAGDRTSKVWIGSDDAVHIERGKGLTSREWDSSLESFLTEYQASCQK